MKWLPFLVLPLVYLVACDSDASNSGSDATATLASRPGPNSCVGCHLDRQPGLMAQWEAGAHAKEGVSCEECHGDDHEAIFRAEGRVTAESCKECHRKETISFRKSAHGRAHSSAIGNARLLMQIPAMQRRGCMTCHQTGGPDPKTDERSSCNGCHGAHAFSVEAARRPESCGACHRGPDHPHIEAYEASRHGVAYGASGDDRQAPTCVTCHMTEGSHDVSAGITIGRSGSGAVLAGETAPIPMHTITPERAAEERKVMINRCADCHTKRTARRALEDADSIKREADRILGVAADIVEGLFRDGLLNPMPAERTAHPTKGHELVLGGPALYEEHSNAERIFFDLAKFAHAITFKGAYHQSPDHTHWLGIARLKASLEELRDEDRRQRRGAKK